MTRLLCGTLVLIFSIVGCTSSSSKSVPATAGASSKFREPASRQAASQYIIDIDQGTIVVGKAKLSRKRGHRGEELLSFRSGSREWGIVRSAVHRIRDGAVDVDADTVPIVSDPMGLEVSSATRSPQCNVLFGHERATQSCPGDSCPVLDGSCVNTNGDCLYSSPCGNNGDGTGVGIGRIMFPGNGAHCNYDFEADIADCYFDLFGTSSNSGPVDLYLDGSFVHNATKVSEDCITSRVTTTIGGWAYAHYWDGKVYGFRPKTWAVAYPDRWEYPADFPIPVLGNGPPPPPNPGVASLDVNYYGYGVPFFTRKAGFCTHAG
jgi:hypothetical protein